MGNKVGRNQLCPCGSGKKFKHCCGRANVNIIAPPLSTSVSLNDILERHRAKEKIRETQQGLGKPIISVEFQGRQGVAVRNRMYFSKKWKTFPDFLGDYLKQILGSEWGNAEIAKPLEARHPIMQWYEAYCYYQKENIKIPGEIYSTPVTGIVSCYLGLAYNLYLLDHNVELQTRLVNRLKNEANFQGAYYELIVASILIRAGFTLTLEDESDHVAKHCEFAAISRHTGKKYWVEAKMRAMAGMLGKNDKDGGTNNNAISRLVPHINGALAKPAADDRLIFIDLNTEPELDEEGKPKWLDLAVSRLEKYEAKELQSGTQAYVFVTNMAFHRRLNEVGVIAALPFGLGMPDFGKPGYYRLSDMYRQKQKHIDAYHIGDSLLNYNRFPITFDGRLPSEVFTPNSSRVIIGETYFFENVLEKGIIGTVTTATISEIEKLMYIGIMDSEGSSHILRQEISDAELEDYRTHRDAYFGKVLPAPKKIKDRYALFEWFMEAYKETPRDTLLKHLSRMPDYAVLEKMSDSDLLIEYCERFASSPELAGGVDDKKKEE